MHLLFVCTEQTCFNYSFSRLICLTKLFINLNHVIS
ncbi:hypothetical protein OIU74_017873 [Salix koriyanagi]|uniref:Uncharacterized protein n=1 Tax=Salix koriyanagi TaxID=2511006 RepID=A0A9Q0WSV8_9ROSI|nr:hypothetical protein OIU74_017873 [Salix koriyanagi]